MIDARRQPVTRPPAGFLEAFSATYESTKQEDLSISESRNLGEKRVERRAKILELTGEDITFLEGQAVPQMTMSEIGRTRAGNESVRQYTQKLADLAARYPDDISTDEAMAIEIKEDSRRIRERTGKVLENTTFGGKIGSFTGAMAAIAQDPPILASMAFGASAAAGILRTAITEAGINIVSEAMIQPMVWRYKKKLESPFGFGEAVTRVLAAGAGGLFLGGAIRAGQKGVTRLLKPRVVGIDDLIEEFDKAIPNPTPEQQAAREVLGDYADVLRESPFDLGDPVADQAHLTATARAIADVEEGRPPDVDAIVEGLEVREEARGQPTEFGEFAFHATSAKNADVIKREGLKPGTFFSRTREEALDFVQIENQPGRLPEEPAVVFKVRTEDIEEIDADPGDSFGQRFIKDKTFRRTGKNIRPIAEEQIGPFGREEIGVFDPDNPLTKQVQALIDPKTKGLTRGGDFVNDLLEKSSSEEILDFIRFTRSDEAPSFLKRFIGSNAAAELRSRGIDVDALNFPKRFERAKVIRVKEPQAPTAPTLNQSLNQFVKNHGGVAVNKSGALRGEFEALLEQGGRKSRSVKRDAGISADQMSQLAHEAGFIDEPDSALLAEALDRDLRGEKVFSDQGEVFQRKMDRKIDREWDRWAEAEEEKYLGELDAKAKGLLDEEDVELSMVQAEREGEPVFLRGKEAGEALESREGAVVRRSAREMLKEAEEELSAGQIVSKCLSGV